MKRTLLVFGIIVILLSACAPAAPAPAPTETNAPVSTSTRTPPAPTSTTSPTNPPTPSITPTHLPFQRPTSGGYSKESFSPDENWVAWSSYGSEIEQYPHVLIENEFGTVRWVITFHDNPEHYSICQPICFMGIAHWSADSQYVYVTADRGGDGFGFYPYADQIAKVNVEGGEIEYLLSGEQGYSYAFSFDGTYLAYEYYQDEWENFTILELETGNQTKVSHELHDVDMLGSLVWVPDNSGFVFSMLRGDIFSIWFLDRNSLTVTELYQGQFCIGQEPAWISGVELQYACFPAEDRSLILNFQTGQVTEVQN